jgi:type IV pilus assembly protein PilY1
VLVYFGTGQYLQSGDIGTASGNQVQSFYAVWDKGGAVTTIDRDQLQAQTIDSKTTEFGMEVRETSKNPVAWDTQFGWYMDLDQAVGERVVSQALLRYGRVIFLTVIPSTDTCDAGGVSWLMEVDAMQGGQTDVSSFDFNNDGLFDDADKLASGETASGVKTTVGITKPPAWFTGEDGKDFKVMTGTSGNLQSLGNKGGVATPGTLRRTYWQQIQ